jgi:ribonuclease P protein component
MDRPASDQRFRPAEHIRLRKDYLNVQRRGRRIPARFMTLQVLPNSGSVGRLGIVATRKLGGAVRRNRAKRLVREVFRRNKPQSGLDIVVVPRPELLAASFAMLETDYRSAMRRYER